MLKFIKSLLSGNKAKEDTPEGLCPNCWGRQEYSGKFYEAMLNERVDLENIDSKVGWINQYAETHLKGIKLEYGEEGAACPSCKVRYRSVD